MEQYLLPATISVIVSIAASMLTVVVWHLARIRPVRAAGEPQAAPAGAAPAGAAPAGAAHSITPDSLARDARLAYEYDARKRLYHEIEPLQFQLYEASERCYDRVNGLVRTARRGELDSVDGCLSREGYHLYATVYHMLAPVVIFRVLQRAASVCDIRLDERVRLRYFLLKWACLAFTDAPEFAGREPPLAYRPNPNSPVNAFDASVPESRRQDLAIGELDHISEAMIVTEAGRGRPVTFPEFEHKVKHEPEFRRRLMPVVSVFANFSFESHRVLARIILFQAMIHRLILYSYAVDTDIDDLKAALDRFVATREFEEDLVWWDPGMESPLGAVRAHIEERLGWTSPDDYDILAGADAPAPREATLPRGESRRRAH